MTENEARMKWCPMARQALPYRTDYYGIDNSSSPVGNKLHTGQIPEGSRCIASDCMMWRWERDKYAEGYELKPDHEDYSKGYCGLGGET